MCFADLNEVKNEIEQMMPEKEIGKLQARQIQLRKDLSALRDPDTDEAPGFGEPGYEEYKSKQAELIELSKSMSLFSLPRKFPSRTENILG